MDIDKAKHTLYESKETMKYGSQNDMLCHIHNLVNSLEFLINEYDKLIIEKNINSEGDKT